MQILKKRNWPWGNPNFVTRRSSQSALDTSRKGVPQVKKGGWTAVNVSSWRGHLRLFAPKGLKPVWTKQADIYPLTPVPRHEMTFPPLLAPRIPETAAARPTCPSCQSTAVDSRSRAHHRPLESHQGDRGFRARAESQFQVANGYFSTWAAFAPRALRLLLF